MLKEPRDAPKRAKKNEIEGQSCLTSELSIMDFKRKRYEFLSLNEKGKADRFCYKRKKEKGEKPYLEKPSLERKKLMEFKKFKEEKHRATMARERRKVKKEKRS